jgi:(E)-4-hydroxy-3-methylbut-2-enyl-diphosphate synthase
MATTILPATEQTYCNSLTSYSRFRTREVAIGDVPLGADNPIRVQSMTTTDTMDTTGTVEQAIRMIEAGCEYVRITAPSINEAKNLENIKRELRARGYKTPLVADIHFTPNAAEIAARIVEKVRVNPGNYADKKKFEVIDYTDVAYEAELARIRERFTPLVSICKEYGTAMRIGTNHGSLSDRIMSRYGDTPHGMVESAMEFLRICEDMNYYNIVLSMKASNPQVMVQAYRLLVHTMIREGMNYPLHLGVTEAGDGEDGRIKSAMGIGTLLEDGLGDTIRVSLTEDPEFEIPVALALTRRYDRRAGHAPIPPVDTVPVHPFVYTRRQSCEVQNIGGQNVPRVVADFSRRTPMTPASLFAVGYNYSVPLDKWNVNDVACDYLYLGDTVLDFELPGTLRAVYSYDTWLQLGRPEHAYPLLTPADFADDGDKSPVLNFIAVTPETLTSEFRNSIRSNNTVVLVLETDNEHAMPALRRAFFQLMNEGSDVPVIVKRLYKSVDELEFRLYSATDTGGLLLDGMGDGVWLAADTVSPHIANSTAFGILQASRTRISRTEYISCPSCGRTLFDLQETTARIRARTDHLKGVKIAIMGCIVNGPGEMADADYGYVGSGPGKITLYKGKTVVRRNVVAGEAVDELIGLIREHGDWVEKEEY